jgi:CHAD domain-containing protein
MTAGIQGTGPYSKLKHLRYEAKKCRYEIEMLSPGPRKLKRLRAWAVEIAGDIAILNAEIKAEKQSGSLL